MDNEQTPQNPTYYPDSSGYMPWADVTNRNFLTDQWPADQATGPSESYDQTTTLDTASSQTIWPDYGFDPSNDFWPSSADASIAFGPYGPVRATSPDDRLPDYLWSPTDQPLPSPSSETPSYVVTSRSGSAEVWPNSGPFSPPTLPPPSQTSASEPNSESPTKGKPITLAAAPPKQQKSKRKADVLTPLTKRPTKADGKRKPENSESPASSSSTSTTSALYTLGGVLPANTDPRLASEQIKREAWQRCKAGTQEMAQRRLLLVNHEHGELEREAQRLQMNLGLMRRGAAMGERERKRKEGGS